MRALLAWAGAVISVIVLSGGVGMAGLRDVGAEEAASLIRANQSREDFVILDLRTPGEFVEERIAGSLLVDFLAPTFRKELSKFDRGKTYLVYCRTGNRSRQALSVFDELGFQRVFHLATGIVKWKAGGFPTIRGEGR